MLISNLDDVIVRFERDQWNAMTREERLATMQEFENRVAAEQGRPPMQVYVMSEEDVADMEGTVGYQRSEGPNPGLYLHPDYFEADESLIPGMNEFAPFLAMATLLHEGRHAWQRYVVASGDENVDQNLRAMMELNFIDYDSETAAYFVQPIEMDARRYALDMLMQIGDRLEEIEGEANPDMLITTLKRYAEEQDYAATVKADVGEEQLELMNELARLRFDQLGMQERYPDVEPDKLSLYAEGLDIVNGRMDFEEFAAREPYAFAEKTLAAFRETPDIPKEGDPGLPESLAASRAAPDNREDGEELLGKTENIFDLIDAEGEELDAELDRLLKSPDKKVDDFEDDGKIF